MKDKRQVEAAKMSVVFCLLFFGKMSVAGTKNVLRPLRKHATETAVGGESANSWKKRRIMTGH